jgi:putative membrane protein
MVAYYKAFLLPKELAATERAPAARARAGFRRGMWVARAGIEGRQEMKWRIACFAVAVGSLALARAAGAQHEEQPARQQSSNQSGNLSPADREFLDTAYSINQGEVKLGEVAKRKGTTDAVRNYGQLMVSDHSLALKELHEFADKANARMPSQLLPQQQRAYDEMSKLSGAEFDRAYIGHMVTGHEAAIGAFTKEAQLGKNPILKDYAQKTLPMLQSHEGIARFDQSHPNVP